MTFDKNLFIGYKNIIETTNIQKCYQEIIRLIKYISLELEKEMPEYSFMGRVVENQMDFSYFQVTRQSLKELGLKVQIIFMHSTCKFEVWISGYNRKVQRNYYELLCNSDCPFEMCLNPERNDFIIKTVIETVAETDEPAAIIAEIKAKIAELESYIQNLNRN